VQTGNYRRIALSGPNTTPPASFSLAALCVWSGLLPRHDIEMLIYLLRFVSSLFDSIRNKYTSAHTGRSLWCMITARSSAVFGD
jgi:hypothetical protein